MNERLTGQESTAALLDAARASLGHFQYESGHHGDLWLDLDALFLDIAHVRPLCAELARRASACRPDIVCGPLTGGAFAAQLVSLELGARFAYAERHAEAGGSATYTVPDALRTLVHDRRVLVVDDAVNAAFAMRATASDLSACGAKVVGFAALLQLGDASQRLASEHRAPLFALATLERRLWTAAECPLCRDRVPLGPRHVRDGRRDRVP